MASFKHAPSSARFRQIFFDGQEIARNKPVKKGLNRATASVDEVEET